MLLSLRNIKKDYTLSKTISVPALKGVNLQIAKGEFVAVIGPSGSGKSTLLNILGCLDNCSSGSYLFEDEEISKCKESYLSDFRRNKVGFIFQSFNLIPTLNVYENVELPLWHSSISHEEKKSRIHDLLDQLEILELKNRFPKHLSGGQQQRVAIARALVRKPLLVLADEPTASLDSKTSQIMLKLLQKEAKLHDTTFIIASHDTELLAKIENKIHLKDGNINQGGN